MKHSKEFLRLLSIISLHNHTNMQISKQNLVRVLADFCAKYFYKEKYRRQQTNIMLGENGVYFLTANKNPLNDNDILLSVVSPLDLDTLLGEKEPLESDYPNDIEHQKALDGYWNRTYPKKAQASKALAMDLHNSCMQAAEKEGLKIILKND